MFFEITLVLFLSTLTRSTIETMSLLLAGLIIHAFIPFSKESGLFNHVLALAVVRTVLYLIFGILGLFSFRKATKSELILSREGGAWLLDWKTRCIKCCIIAVILGVFMLLPGMICLITGSNFYRACNPYVMVSYAGAFLFFGGAASIVFDAVVKLCLLRRIRFISSDGIEEEALPKKKHHWGRFAGIAGLATVLAVFLMFRGTWYIQPYIATIPAVEHRQISVEYDEQTYQCPADSVRSD